MKHPQTISDVARQGGKVSKADRSDAMRKAVLARWHKTRKEQGHE